MSVGISKFGWVSALLLAGMPAFGQAVPDTSVAAALGSVGSRAAVVFAGEVTAIRHTGGVVEVEFRVDQAVKGQVSGSYVLREWAGLWAAGQRRYWVGERAVMFLNGVGKSGLSSSVDGMEGILPLTPTSSATLAVDVDRLRTRVERAVGAPMTAAGVRLSLAEVTSAVVGEPAPVGLPRPRPVPRPVRRLPVGIQPLQPDDDPQQLLPARRINDTVEPADGIR